MTDKTAVLEYLHRHLDDKRLRHVFGVRDLAVHLARRHGADPEAAELAALLHDCAKWMPLEEQLAACEAFGISLTPEDRLQPSVLHAYVGAAIAQKRFGAPEPVVQAIRAHTTGWDPMGLLDRVLYVADFSEPNRSYPQAEQVRTLAEEDLTGATIVAMTHKLRSLLDRGRPIHPRTVAARNRLLLERAESATQEES
ncbi:MAG: hydrolase [Candidatus Poribacteria bacterium]|nr:MAG: hydrolase [Candidatus Poribacteria bacterium]